MLLNKVELAIFSIYQENISMLGIDYHLDSLILNEEFLELDYRFAGP